MKLNLTSSGPRVECHSRGWKVSGDRLKFFWVGCFHGIFMFSVRKKKQKLPTSPFKDIGYSDFMTSFVLLECSSEIKMLFSPLQPSVFCVCSSGLAPFKKVTGMRPRAATSPRPAVWADLMARVLRRRALAGSLCLSQTAWVTRDQEEERINVSAKTQPASFHHSGVSFFS